MIFGTHGSKTLNSVQNKVFYKNQITKLKMILILQELTFLKVKNAEWFNQLQQTVIYTSNI